MVGDALEELYPDRHGELAAVLAMHFEQAGDTDKAVTYLMSAAKFAYDRNAIAEAFDLYARGAAILPQRTEDEDAVLLRKRVEIGLGQARVGFAFLDRAEQIEILDQVVADAERLGDLRLIADAHLNNALQRQFEGERRETSPELRKSLDRVAEIAIELDDPKIAALPKSVIGLSQVFSGELREGIRRSRNLRPSWLRSEISWAPRSPSWRSPWATRDSASSTRQTWP